MGITVYTPAVNTLRLQVHTLLKGLEKIAARCVCAHARCGVLLHCSGIRPVQVLPLCLCNSNNQCKPAMMPYATMICTA
jgi:hypothetical protein